MIYVLNRAVIIFPLLIILSVCPGSGATYYVDSSCRQSGDGTTPICGPHGPFKSWAEVKWAAGNIYSQKGGTTTYETIKVNASGTKANVITINSYGSGKAMIDGSLMISSNAWTANDPVTGVYSIPATLARMPLYEDDVPVPYATTSSCLDGNTYWQRGVKNYYKPSSGTPSNHTLQYYRPGSDSLGIGLDLGANSYITIDGLSFRRWRTDIGTSVTINGTHNDYVTIMNCSFDDSGWGIYIFATQATSTNITIAKNSFSHLMNSLELASVKCEQVGDIGKFDTVTISNNIISNCSQAKNTSSIFTNYVTIGSGFDTEGIGLQNIKNSIISANNINGLCRGVVLYACSNSQTHNNLFSNNFIDTSQAPIILYNNKAGKFYENNLYYNILRGGRSDGWDSALVLQNAYAGMNYIYNNTIISTAGHIVEYVWIADYFTFKNNIFVHSDNYGHIFDSAYEIPHTVFDYNLWSAFPESYALYVLNSNYYTYAQWRGTLGFDTHSPAKTSDPLFASASSGNYTLTSSSPAKWAGLNVGLTADCLGNPVNDPPSIGAYEYISKPGPPTHFRMY